MCGMSFYFREVREKWDIEFADSNTELYYKESKTYVFDRERSNNLTEEDNITTVNIAMVVGSLLSS